MTIWNHVVELKYLFTENEDYGSVVDSMAKIADELDTLSCFKNFDYSEFRNIPKGDKRFSHLDYANDMINDLYNYADTNRIWIQ